MGDRKVVLERALTVEELITHLQKHDPKARVMYAYPARDHWHTALAATVRAAEDETIVWSEYHDTFKVPKEEYPPEPGEKTFNVVILR